MNTGRKTIPVHVHHHEEEIQEKEYGKLALVFVAILALSGIAFLLFDTKGPFDGMTPLESFAAQFMGVFFLVFAAFKLVNLSSFVHGFMMYDIIAHQSRPYAYAYPFLQLLLGGAMFVAPSSVVTHFLAAVLSGIALIGVANSLRHKKEIQCACLGNVIKMPLATVSGIEDGLMFVLAVAMVVAMAMS